MLGFIREWLGLTALEKDVRDVIDRTNMRVALVACFPLMLAQLYLVQLTRKGLVDGMVAPQSQSAQACGWMLGLSVVCIVAAALVLLVCAVGYHKNMAFSRACKSYAVQLHAVLSVSAGILLSMLDTQDDGGTFLLLTFLVGSLCVFAHHPLFTMFLTVGSFGIYDGVGALAQLDLQPPTLVSSTLWFCVLLSGIFRYNSERHHAKAEISAKRASCKDFLTGLGNRMALRGDMEAMRAKTPYLVAIMDIDDFKYYNDAYGHDAGDMVLREYSRALSKCFGSCSSYRYGGDEFLVVCDKIDEQEFIQKTKAFRAMIAEISVADSSPQVTSSLGYALGVARGWKEFQEVLRTADERLFYAKRQGKNRSVGPAADAMPSHVKGMAGSHSIDPSIGRMHKLDDVDPLTKLCNINAFLRRAQILLDDEERIESGLMIAYLDLEGFAGYNERYGFEAGDKVLCDVANLLTEKFPNHLIAHMGADHFAVAVYPDVLSDQQSSLHEEVRSLGGGVRIDLKIGLCQPKPHESLQASVACDRAQEAADSIKGRRDVFVRVYDDELRFAVEQRRYIVNNIESAISQGKVEVYLQPIIRSLNGRMCAIEALSRWNDETYGLIPPSVYIGVLEESRLIHLHDLYMVREVARNVRSLIDRNIERLPVSINLSRVDFDLRDMPREIDEILDHYGVPHELICLEITESAMSEGGERLAHMVEQFRASGHAVWLDDFGSGYSSLNTLKDLDFDLIKIDMEFIRQLDSRPASRVIVSSAVDMAKRLGLQTLVEGVETDEQLDFVRGVGCELIQGFYFSRPVEAKTLERNILAGKVIVERDSEHKYYSEIGRVNVLSPTPLVLSRDGGSEDGPEQLRLALAIVEVRGGLLSCLQMSEGFAEVAHDIGAGSLLGDDADLQTSPRVASFQSLLNVAKSSAEIETLELAKGNSLYQVRARYVASTQEADSFAVTVLRSGSSIFSHASASESVFITDMLYMFDQVDLFDLETGAAQNIFRCNADYPYGYEGDDVREMAIRYVQENVHPQDQQGFIAFEDVSTAEERLEQLHTNVLTAAFRIRSQRDGGWHWKMFTLLPVTYDGRHCLLSAARDADIASARKIMRSDVSTY